MQPNPVLEEAMKELMDDMLDKRNKAKAQIREFEGKLMLLDKFKDVLPLAVKAQKHRSIFVDVITRFKEYVRLIDDCEALANMPAEQFPDDKDKYIMFTLALVELLAFGDPYGDFNERIEQAQKDLGIEQQPINPKFNDILHEALERDKAEKKRKEDEEAIGKEVVQVIKSLKGKLN